MAGLMSGGGLAGADDPVTRPIIGAAIAVHRVLGPGLLESAYQACLAVEFARRGIVARREVPVPLWYEGVAIDCSYRLDFLVAELVIVEVKAVEKVLPVHEAQLLTYLKLTGKPVGLLINFNVPQLVRGIVRRVYHHERGLA